MKLKTLIFVGVTAAAVLFLPYSKTPTGNTKVVQESVCSHSTLVGAGGHARHVCDKFKTISVTDGEFTYKNLAGYSWTGYDRGR